MVSQNNPTFSLPYPTTSPGCMPEPTEINISSHPHSTASLGKAFSFTHAYCAAPSCAPSRAAILTGRHIWQLEEGGILFGILKAKFPVFTLELGKAGYELAATGKTWGPGVPQGFGSLKGSVYKASSTQAVFGPAFSRYKLARRITGISANDYAANFADFLGKRDRDKPFFSGTVRPSLTRTTRLVDGRNRARSWGRRCCPSAFPTIP